MDSREVIETLSDVMVWCRIPEKIRSDNGPEFLANGLRKWLGRLETGTLCMYIEPRSLWENGYCESFDGKLRDECLNGEIFYSLKEAPDCHRTVATAVQPGAAACLTRL